MSYIQIDALRRNGDGSSPDPREVGLKAALKADPGLGAVVVGAILKADPAITNCAMSAATGLSPTRVADLRAAITGWPKRRAAPRRGQQLGFTWPICRPGSSDSIGHEIDRLIAEGKPVNAMAVAQKRLGVGMYMAKQVVDARRDAMAAQH